VLNEKEIISLDLYSKVQHYLNYKGLLSPCEWLQYINTCILCMYMYACVLTDVCVCLCIYIYIYIYVCVCVCVRIDIFAHIYVCFCKQEYICFMCGDTNVSHGCGYECMFCGTKWKVGTGLALEKSIEKESEKEGPRAWARGARDMVKTRE